MGGWGQGVVIKDDGTGKSASVDSQGALRISGDVSTKPLAGQVWPVTDNNGSLTIDGTVAVSSIPVVTIGSSTASLGVSGDVLVRGGNAIAVKVDGSTVTQPVSFSSVTIGAITTLVGISGDVSTTPKSGQTWPVSSASTLNVREQGIIGSQIVGGISSTIGISGDTGIELIDSAGINRATIYNTGAIRISGDVIEGAFNIEISNRRFIITSAPQQITANLVNRKQIRFLNLSPVDMYVGKDNSVVSGDGFPLFSQTGQPFKWGSNIQPWFMVVSGSGDLRVMEEA